METKNRKVVIKQSHSRGPLSAIPTAFNHKKGGDPRLQISGMTLNLLPLTAVRFAHSSSPARGEENSGFTLIELLVVVLIIAVLSAVAVPQYQKAVKRSHATEVFTVLNTLDKALADYYLAYGNYADINTDSISITIPSLNYWEFSNQVGCTYHSITEDPTIFRVTNSNSAVELTMCVPLGGKNRCFIGMNENIMVYSKWEQGKLTTRHCSDRCATSSCKYNCEDYLNCHRERAGGTQNLGGTSVYVAPGTCLL